MKYVIFLWVLILFSGVAVAQEPATFEYLATLGRGRVADASWSPDGRTIAVASTTGVWLHNADDWQAAPQLLTDSPERTQVATAIAYHPRGGLLAVGYNNGLLRLWDTEAQIVISTLNGHSSTVHSLSFNDEGTRLVSSDYYMAGSIVWDMSTGERVATYSDSYKALFRPHSEQVVGISRDAVTLYAEDGTATVLAQTNPYLNDLAFSPDGNHLAVANYYDRILHLWNFEQDRYTDLEETTAYSVTFVNNEQVVVGLADGQIHILALHDEYPVVATFEAHQNPVRDLFIGRNTTLYLSHGFDQALHIWRNTELVATIEGYTDEIMSLDYNADGSLLAAASADGAVRLWNTADNSLQQITRQGWRMVRHVVFHPDGNRLLITADDHVYLWDIDTDTPPQLVFSHVEGESYRKAIFSPDGSLLASTVAGTGQVVLLDAERMEITHTLEVNTASVLELSFSPDSRSLAVFVSAYDHNQIKVYDVQSGESLTTLTAPFFDITAAAFSPDGQSLALTNWDGSFALLDAENGESSRVIESYPSAHGGAIAFSPDGRWLLLGLGEDAGLHIYSFPELRAIAWIDDTTDYETWISSVELSPDSRTLAVGYGTGDGGGDGVIRLWQWVASR